MNLSGKDFFTQEEAAYYCCVSLRKFRDEANAAGIRPVKWGGKLIYRGIDCQRALDREFNKWR